MITAMPALIATSKGLTVRAALTDNAAQVDLPMEIQEGALVDGNRLLCSQTHEGHPQHPTDAAQWRAKEPPDPAQSW